MSTVLGQRGAAGLARILLMVLDALVAVTAFGGGVALVLGAMSPALATILTPPPEYLDGSPFSSYLIPGLALAILVGGVHLLALVLLVRRHPWATRGAAVSGFGMLIWIFVQMVYIPFSFLQAAYVIAGLAELGLVLLMLGILRTQDPERAAA